MHDRPSKSMNLVTNLSRRDTHQMLGAFAHRENTLSQGVHFWSLFNSLPLSWHRLGPGITRVWKIKFVWDECISTGISNQLARPSMTSNKSIAVNPITASFQLLNTWLCWPLSLSMRARQDPPTPGGLFPNKCSSTSTALCSKTFCTPSRNSTYRADKNNTSLL